MERWKEKVAVVTGVSAGIGKAIAIDLVKAGMQVVGLQRRAEIVQELAKQLHDQQGKLYGLKCDITKEEDILKSFKWIDENLGIVHVLVNNAAIARPTNLIDGNTLDWKNVIDTNLTAICLCTREAIKSMRANKPEVAGHIIHVNSITGHYVSPTISQSNVYPATKHGVTALAQTLRHELNQLGSHIKITSLSPGFTRSEIFVTNGFYSEKEMEKIYKETPVLEAEDVVNAVTYILSTKPNVVIEELTLRPINERI